MSQSTPSPEEMAESSTLETMAELTAAARAFYQSVEFDQPVSDYMAASADLVTDEADDGDA